MITTHTLTPFQRGCLFVLQRSLHDSNHNIYNHRFNIGYGLDILRAAPSKRLKYTMKRSGMEAVRACQ